MLEISWRFHEAAPAVFISHPEITGGRKAYVVVDQSPSAKKQRATIAQARSTVLKVPTAVADVAHIKSDFMAAVVYSSPNPDSDEGLVLFCRLDKNGSRRWDTERMRAAFPSLDPGALEAATIAALAE